MIVEYVRYALKEHSADELRAGYVAAVEHLRGAPECLGYELTQCEEDEASFTLRIVWQSTDAHLNGFRRGPNFPAFLDAIRPFIPEIAEMRHYRPTGVEWARG